MGRKIYFDYDDANDIQGLSNDEALNKALNQFGREMKERFDIDLSEELMDLFFNDWFYDRLDEEEILRWKKGQSL